MINLLHAGAVPFGYTSDNIESELSCCIEDCVFTGMSSHYYSDVRGTFPLPDVILSNTPPPSPLRRARSCHAFFPEKTQTQPPSPLTPPATPGAAFDGDAGVQAVQTGLSHIQEVRRRLLGSSTVNPQQLPQLSWPLPRPPNPPSPCGTAREEGDAGAEERRNPSEVEGAEALREEQQQQLRLVGVDLRRVADMFQRNSSKASGKPSDEAAARILAPAVLGRCLAASLLCLVWWRLYNKLR